MLNRFVVAMTCLVWGCSPSPEDAFRSWKTYNGTPAAMKYSSLQQIDTTNVTQLEVAWMYRTGDADTVHHSQIQCNPIVIDGVLYGVGPQMKLFAVDASTGIQKWIFDPNQKTEFDDNPTSQHIMVNSRGIAYWTDNKSDKRIFFTAGSNTFAVDAITGKAILSFGKDGSIDLHDGLDRDVNHLFVVSTSPGIIYKDLLIMGTRVNEATPSAPGHIRAFDVRTGKRVWIFHTIPHPGEEGFESWEDPNAWKNIGGANVWSGFSLDEQRGILFAPTGSAAYDFYGGKRKGSNLFANCLLALDANTGKRIWHFQFMHHDVWDKDLPAPPVLLTINRHGRSIDVVAQTTKNGMVYVFERETGKPVFEIDEIPVDTVTDLMGERLWPTQPVPRLPLPFSRQTLTENDINPFVNDIVKTKLIQAMKDFRKGSMYTPPGKTSSLVFPGYDGGGEWGGPAVDPHTGILYVNANEMAWIMKMNENPLPKPKKETRLEAGQRLFQLNCSSCHGTDRRGTGNNPSLVDAKSKYTNETFSKLLKTGRRMMPAFGHLDDETLKALATYVLELKGEYHDSFIDTHAIDTINHMPYIMDGYRKFLTPDGYPAISPPWGTLNAIDLNTGELIWKQVLGEYDELKAKGIPPTGTENYGGPVVTAGGLVFIAATRDNKFRAFNKTTGKLLWEYNLPASGFATPAIYEWAGKQYVVIACGGGKLGTKSGDAYVAFALRKH